MGKKAAVNQNLLSEDAFTSTNVDDFKSLSKEQIAAMRDAFQEKAREELNK